MSTLDVLDDLLQYLHRMAPEVAEASRDFGRGYSYAVRLAEDFRDGWEMRKEP